LHEEGRHGVPIVAAEGAAGARKERDEATSSGSEPSRVDFLVL